MTFANGHQPETRRDAAVHLHVDRDNDRRRHHAVPALDAELYACRSNGGGVWPAHRFHFAIDRIKPGRDGGGWKKDEKEKKEKENNGRTIVVKIRSLAGCCSGRTGMRYQNTSSSTEMTRAQ